MVTSAIKEVKSKNHKEIPQHTYKEGYDKKEKLTSVDDAVEKLEPLHTAGGIQNGAAALHNSLAVPSKG